MFLQEILTSQLDENSSERKANSEVLQSKIDELHQDLHVTKTELERSNEKVAKFEQALQEEKAKFEHLEKARQKLDAELLQKVSFYVFEEFFGGGGILQNRKKSPLC